MTSVQVSQAFCKREIIVTIARESERRARVERPLAAASSGFRSQPLRTPERDLDYAMLKARDKHIVDAMSNGFGGHDASLLFKKL